MKAYCRRSGQIQFTIGPMPEGALPIRCKALSHDEFMARVTARARLAKDNETLLMPGVPEAKDEVEAIAAYFSWMNSTFPENRVRK